jgi:phenylpropionate dioxygenase-like ring-hydroxylating dioxygenase large terminal subunit
MAHMDTDFLERAIQVLETRTPELAKSQMKVPLSYYRDPEIHARERALFTALPRPLAGSTQIGEPGDYMVRRTMGLSVLLTRDDDGRAHAFLNYCRHRGAEPAKGCGNASRLSCPYHGWTYDMQGRLVGMPLRDRNSAIDFGEHGLVELPSEERHGLIWVVLTPGAKIDVAAHLGAVDRQLADQGLDKLRYYPALSMAPIAANWKCVGEGVIEALHVPFIHAATFNVTPKTDDTQTSGRYNSFADIGLYDRHGDHVHWMIPLFSRDDTDGVRREFSQGRHLDWRMVGNIWLLAPGILIANDQYGFDVGVMEPGDSVDTAFMHYGWLAPQEAPSGWPSPEVMAQRAAIAIAEDQVVWEGCGRGLARGGHDYAIVGRNEKGVQFFHESLAELTGYRGLGYI